MCRPGRTRGSAPTRAMKRLYTAEMRKAAVAIAIVAVAAGDLKSVALHPVVVTVSAQSAQSAQPTQSTTPTVPAETLLDRAILTALDQELSGVAAKDHVGRLTQMHRVPASPGFHDAIEYVMDRVKAIGLSDVHVETFPGDGTTRFGTLHGNRSWRISGGFLDDVTQQPRRIRSY